MLVDPAEYSRQVASIGTQEFVNLSEDLLVVCTNFAEFPSSPRLSWNYNLRGWLYLHFRRDRLPRELQRFQSGDEDVDFWVASTLTADMRDVIKAMFRSSLHPSIRPVYLRAKTTELICLALQRLHERELTPSALKLSRRDVECLREARRLLGDSNPTPSLQQLAHQVGINRRKLVLGFKQVFGMTVGDYARERGISFGWYPSGLNSGHTQRGNFLPSVERYPNLLDVRLARRPRIVYEFDQADLVSGYMFPAMVRTMRGVGAQFAAIFVYDTLATAQYNLSWQTHFINLLHTPRKAMSAVIAAEAMRRLPRSSLMREPEHIFSTEFATVCGAWRSILTPFRSVIRSHSRSLARLFRSSTSAVGR